MTIIITTLLFATVLFLYSSIKKAEANTIEYVYVNEKTKKYHLEECPYAKDLEKVSIKNALENGYMPCKICNHE